MNRLALSRIASTLAVACGLAAVVTPPAHAASLYVAPLSCAPMNAAAANDFDFREAGVGNLSTTARRYLFCPFDRQGLAPMIITNIEVNYLDLNSNTADGNFWCYTFRTFTNGGNSWGSSRWGCLAAGGCSANTSLNHFSSSAFYLSLANPFGAGTNVAGDAMVGIACEVPPKTALGTSRVIGIRVDY